MSKSNNLTDFLTSIADAIRSVENKTETINPQDFESRIRAMRPGITDTATVRFVPTSPFQFALTFQDENYAWHSLRFGSEFAGGAREFENSDYFEDLESIVYDESIADSRFTVDGEALEIHPAVGSVMTVYNAYDDVSTTMEGNLSYSTSGAVFDRVLAVMCYYHRFNIPESGGTYTLVCTE